MKKLEKIKTIQLIVFIILTALCFLLIAGRRSVYAALSSDPNLRIVPTLTWIIMSAPPFRHFLLAKNTMDQISIFLISRKILRPIISRKA